MAAALSLCSSAVSSLLVQLEVILGTRVRDSFTLDLSRNHLLPKTLPVIISWLKEYPLLRVALATNCLSFQQDLCPLLLDEQVPQ